MSYQLAPWFPDHKGNRVPIKSGRCCWPRVGSWWHQPAPLIWPLQTPTAPGAECWTDCSVLSHYDLPPVAMWPRTLFKQCCSHSQPRFNRLYDSLSITGNNRKNVNWGSSQKKFFCVLQINQTLMFGASSTNLLWGLTRAQSELLVQYVDNNSYKSHDSLPQYKQNDNI